MPQMQVMQYINYAVTWQIHNTHFMYHGSPTTQHIGISASVTPAVRALRTHQPTPAVLAEHSVFFPV